MNVPISTIVMLRFQKWSTRTSQTTFTIHSKANQMNWWTLKGCTADAALKLICISGAFKQQNQLFISELGEGAHPEPSFKRD